MDLYKSKQLIRDIFLYFGNPLSLFDFSPQHKKLIELGPFDSVLHIGADIGQELSLYNFIGVRRVIWIEPNPKSISKLKRRAFFYPRIKQIFINALISNTTGQQVVFYKFNKSGASSVFKPTEEFLRSDKKRFVSETTVYVSSTIEDALGKTVNFEGDKNLLVIDTQCSEFKILSVFPKSLMSKFGVLMCEVSVDQYEVNYTPSDLIRIINAFGFKQVLSPLRKSDDTVFVLDKSS
jgi:FkbM family methyltransferase